MELMKAASVELQRHRKSIRNSDPKSVDEQRMTCVCIEALDSAIKVSVDHFDDGTAATEIRCELPFQTFFELVMMLAKEEAGETN
jgi:hypothetical protein